MMTTMASKMRTTSSILMSLKIRMMVPNNADVDDDGYPRYRRHSPGSDETTDSDGDGIGNNEDDDTTEMDLDDSDAFL